MRNRLCLALALGTMLAVAAHARAQPQRLQITGHLTGYQCMMLTLSVEQLRNSANLPPILAEPRSGASELGVASGSVIVSSPPEVRNGYTRVLHLDGRTGWMQSNLLKPWVNQSNPQIRCIPAMMSNGRPGFDYPVSR